MSKIQLTYNLVCEFLSSLRIEVGTETDELNILSLEGDQPLAEPGFRLQGWIGYGVMLSSPRV
ncbi:hypothetical protein JXM67_02645 [candidate division WOR-3 bacterium]|nr:hypothetical protein [candidate division WOR-3 bacterium]